MKTYKRDMARECSLFSIKAWHEGESTELKKWIGFGFFNHIFISKNGLVRLYYDIEEGEKFHEILTEKLNDNLFDALCDNLFSLIEKSKGLKSEEEIYNLIVKCWPSFTIFDEVSKYPEFVSDAMMRRLMRVRKSTESFSYEIENQIDTTKMPKDYLFFQGKIIEKPFEKFIEENKIFIEK